MTSLRSFMVLFVLVCVVSVLGVLFTSSLAPQSESLSPGSATVSAVTGSPHLTRHSNTVWLPGGSTLVIGSLDRTAQHHLIDVQWEPAGEAKLAAFDRATESSELFDVQRVAQSARVAGCYFEPTEYKGQSLPPVECDSEAMLRRFCVPYFPGKGGAFERMVIGNVIAAGATTRVYLANDQTSPEGLTPLAHEIVHHVETGLREFVEEQLAPIADVDFDNHLTFVMCRLAGEDAVAPGEEPIRGCVREKDFLNASGDLAGDLIYVDVDLPRGRQLAAVLAHELAHAATFSSQRRSNANSANRRLPFWLNEGIAHMLEYSVCPASENLKDRLARYTQSPSAFPLVFPDDYPSRMVRRGPARAAALSFLRFLSSKRPCLLADVLESGFEGIDGLEIGAGDSFDELFREWCVSELKDLKPAHCVSREQFSLTIAGTSYATIGSHEKGGYATIEASNSAMLQLTVVEPDSENQQISRLPTDRF